MSINLFQHYETITCCHHDCLISFAITEEFYNKRLKDKKSFYCPNGHSQYFISETEEEKLKKEVIRLDNKVNYIRSCKRCIEYSRRHYKGEVTKLKKRLEG